MPAVVAERGRPSLLFRRLVGCHFGDARASPSLACHSCAQVVIFIVGRTYCRFPPPQEVAFAAVGSGLKNVYDMTAMRRGTFWNRL